MAASLPDRARTKRPTKPTSRTLRQPSTPQTQFGISLLVARGGGVKRAPMIESRRGRTPEISAGF
jgi:hypothetical protein